MISADPSRKLEKPFKTNPKTSAKTIRIHIRIDSSPRSGFLFVQAIRALPAVPSRHVVVSTKTEASGEGWSFVVQHPSPWVLDVVGFEIEDSRFFTGCVTDPG